MKQLKHILYSCLPGFCLLCLFSGCFSETDSMVCPGFKSEPYVDLYNRANRTYMVYVQSGDKEIGPMITGPFENLRIPFDMNSTRVVVRLESGGSSEYFALNYALETSSCYSDDDLRITFKSLHLDPQIRSFSRLYLGANPQERVTPETDLAFWFKYKEPTKASDKVNFNPLFLIQ